MTDARTGADGLGILNGSGFPFQLRVVSEIGRVTGQHGHWRVDVQEHLWSDERTGESGFIDLVAASGAARLVVECKRTSGATWAFVGSGGSAKVKYRVRTYVTGIVQGRGVGMWSDVDAMPGAPEVTFCAVQGSGNKEPMLERLAATLMRSTECIAQEALALHASSGKGGLWLYTPVLVTTARLIVATFDPQSVDPESGHVPHDQAAWETVPIVRLRKQFGRGIGRSDARSLSELQAENEQTLLVVNAADLVPFLRDFELEGGGAIQALETYARLHA